jgi:lactoylglutathione lyase
MHLYETHLPVANTRASVAFYVEMLGMTFAYRDPSRDIAFLWIEENRRSMLGLWDQELSTERLCTKAIWRFP